MDAATDVAGATAAVTAPLRATHEGFLADIAPTLASIGATVCPCRRVGQTVAQVEVRVGAMSANYPSWVARRGAATGVAAAAVVTPASGSSHNHPK